MTLSEKLSTLMNSCNLSIKDVFNRTGVPVSHIKKMLSKPDYNPSNKDIELLCLLFKLPINNIMDPQYKVVIKNTMNKDDSINKKDDSKNEK